MHARVEQLLSLRDGEPVDAAVKTHVEHCRECAVALGETAVLQSRLQSLPVADALPGGWQAVRQRQATRLARAHLCVRTSRLALAASIAVVAATLAWRFSEPPALPAAATLRIAPLTAEEALADDRVAQLRNQSAALEELLAEIGEGPVVERAGTAVPIDTLEAQVQWIDHQLSDNGDVRAAEDLWRERVQAMNSLVRLRYVEAQRIAM